MSLVKNLWTSVQGDPVFMRRLNGWLTLFWVVMIPVSYELGWLKSVVYVSALSLWALVAGHWSTWQAARVEVTQQKEREKLEDSPVEERVVEKIVQDTALDPAPWPRQYASRCLRTSSRVRFCGHHRRRLRRVRWEHVLDARPSGWAVGEPSPRHGNKVDVLIDGACGGR